MRGFQYLGVVMFRRWVNYCAVAGVATCLQAAEAQTRPPAPSKEADPLPQSSTSTYGTWQLLCSQTSSDAAGGQGKRCEVSQTIVDERKQPTVRIATGIDASNKRTLVIQTPLGPRVDTSVVLRIDGVAAAISVPFRNCTVDGCFAEADLTDMNLAALRSRADAKAAIELTNINKTIIRVPMSLNGFDAAWIAFTREIRSK